MMPSNYKVERIVFGLLLCVALLMLFAPLVNLHSPNGGQTSGVFDLHDDMTQLQSNLRIIAAKKPSPTSAVSLSPVAQTHATSGVLALPFSLREATLIPWFVLAAWAFCFLALLDLFFFRKAFAILASAGGCCAAIALLHVLLMGSDVQPWTQELMLRASLTTPDDPAMGTRIFMVNSFLVSPALGLYILTSSLLLVPALSFTHAVPRLSSVLRHDSPRVAVSQPVRVRPVNSQFPEETCTSLDLSQSGLRLETASNHYYVGMEVYLTRKGDTSAPAQPNEEHGHVVRVEKAQNGRSRIAIRIISEG